MSATRADLNAIHRALLNRLDAFIAWLRINGKRAGNTWEGGEKGARITIKLSGDPLGAWGAWSASKTGRNLIGLIAFRKAIKFGEAIGEARAFLGEAAPSDNRPAETEQDDPRA